MLRINLLIMLVAIFLNSCRKDYQLITVSEVKSIEEFEGIKLGMSLDSLLEEVLELEQEELAFDADYERYHGMDSIIINDTLRAVYLSFRVKDDIVTSFSFRARFNKSLNLILNESISKYECEQLELDMKKRGWGLIHYKTCPSENYYIRKREGNRGYVVDGVFAHEDVIEYTVSLNPLPPLN